MTEKIDIEKLVKMYASVKKKLLTLEPEEKVEYLNKYLEKDFKDDLASFMAIAVKIYTYLGYQYFEDLMTSIDTIIKTYEAMENFPV